MFHVSCLWLNITCFEGRESAVCIETRYGVDGPGIKFRWGRDLQQLFRTVLGPTQPHIQWGPGHSRG